MFRHIIVSLFTVFNQIHYYSFTRIYFWFKRIMNIEYASVSHNEKNIFEEKKILHFLKLNNYSSNVIKQAKLIKNKPKPRKIENHKDFSYVTITVVKGI